VKWCLWNKAGGRAVWRGPWTPVAIPHKEGTHDPCQALPIALNDRPELDQDAVGAAPMTRSSTTTESQRRRGPDARAPVCRDLRRATACAEIEQLPLGSIPVAGRVRNLRGKCRSFVIT